MPKRGAVALVTTVLAVALLFGFTPADQTGLSGSIPTTGMVGAPPVSTPAPVALGPQPQGTATPTHATRSQATPRTGTAGPTATPLTQVSTPTDAPTNAPGAAGASGTFTGDAVNTAYGTVQIALQVQNGKIVDVQELQMPNERRLSAQISAEAGPMLRDEVLRAQSANINGVSGASYTSYGFWESLQSALAQIS